jgi:hypothetical protein
MAKELPYFKFEPNAWDTGNIQMCSRESKGLFTDLCSLYWSRLGELPYALALQKLCNGNHVAFEELIKHDIFGLVDGQIIIEFLDEQLLELNQISEKRRKAAHKRWDDASALQVDSKSNAKRREEKRREERRKKKKREEPAVAVPFVDKVLKVWDEWVQFRKEKKASLTPTTIKKQIQFLGGRGDPEIIAILNQSMTNGYTGLFELKKQNNGIGRTNQTTVRRADAIIEPGKEFGSF